MVRMVDLVKKSGDGKSAPRNTPGPPKSQSGDSGGFSLSSAQAPAPPISTPRRRGCPFRGKIVGAQASVCPPAWIPRRSIAPIWAGGKTAPGLSTIPPSPMSATGKNRVRRNSFGPSFFLFLWFPRPGSGNFAPPPTGAARFIRPRKKKRPKTDNNRIPARRPWRRIPSRISPSGTASP